MEIKPVSPDGLFNNLKNKKRTLLPKESKVINVVLNSMAKAKACVICGHWIDINKKEILDQFKRNKKKIVKRKKEKDGEKDEEKDRPD